MTDAMKNIPQKKKLNEKRLLQSQSQGQEFKVTKHIHKNDLVRL